MSNDGMISFIGNTNTTVVDGNNSLIVAGNGNDTLAAGSTSIVVAGNGNDTITVGAGSAITAGNGNDTLTAGSSSIVIAGNGSDTVAVGANSAIAVGNGNDTLSAGANSIIIAGNGNDTINLGASDTVTVGTGKDTFVLPGDGQVTLTAPQSLSVSEDGTIALAIAAVTSGFGWGQENIFDFNVSNDKIQLNSAQFANFAAVMAAAKQVGSNTVITADASDSIVLNNVKLSSLTAKDFAFTAAPALVYTISGIPADATLTDTAGAIQVVNGTATLTQAQLAGLTLKAGEVTAANLVVTATDPTTGHSVSKVVALSVTPVAPTLHTPATLNVATGGTIALGITETPFDLRDTVSITISGVPTDASLSAGTKNANGSWTLTPAQLTNLTLTAGAATTASLTVTATNTLGQTASSPAAHIQLTIASPLSVTFDKVTFIDTGVQGDHLTDNSTVTLSGTLTDTLAVSKVNVYNAGGLIGSATINPDHTWTLTTALADGNYNQLSVTATDIAGTRASATTSQYVLIDTTAPTVNSQSESNPGLTQSTAEVITVNASDANGVQSVAIYNDVTHQKVGDAMLGGGVWTYTATGLADGTYKYYAVVTDNAGNQTKTADLTTVTVDTTAPTVISESESVSGPTQLTTDIIKVNATDLNGVASVAVYDHATGQKVGDAALGSDGAWAVTASNLSGGAHTFYAIVTDNAGNHTTTTDLATVTVDNTPPVISFGQVKLDSPDSTGTMSNDGGATLSGTVSDNIAVAQVQVFNGSTLLGTANVANGTWTLHTVLSVGSYDQLHATATDTAGNSTDIASHSVVTITQVAGLATDGYISGATVFADTNGNGKLDAGEASGITDASGHFVLGPGTTSGPLVLTGGTDTATGQQFTGVLTAPTGSTQVTALTTLVQSVAVANGGDVTAASQAVAAALGIDPTIDLTKTDILTNAYTGDAQPFVAAAKVLNTVSMVASAVAGTGASNFTSAATGAFSALAAQIVSTGGLDLSNSSVVNAVVTSTLASAGATLTGTQTSDIANVVTSVNTATDQAVQASAGGTTANLLANVSATSIVAQGSASTDLEAGTHSGDLSTAVANNTSTALSTAVQGAVSQVSTASLAPAAPNFVSLTPTDASPTALNAVHYLLTFSNSVQGVTASDFSLAINGLTGASITSVTAVAGSAGAQYLVEINPGSGNGTLSLNFAGTTVKDLSGAALQDQSTHTATSYAIDHSAGEQAALALAVTNTQVNAAGSALLNFTISGLQPTDTGVVTFTDGQNSVSVNVNGGQSTYTASLSALSDGPISSQLAVNTNAAGHAFTPVAGSSAVTLTGFSSPPASGISVVQNATGDIGVVSAVAVTNQSGIGLLAQETSGGVGNIVVNTTGSVTGTGSGSVGLEAQNLDASNGGNVSVAATGGVTGNQHAIVASTAGSGNVSVEAGGAIASTVQFGVRAAAYGTGNVSVLTDAGSTINSGGAGISAVNFDTVLAASANSSVTVTNNAVINSGTTLNPSGSVPQGIAAGYYGANGTSNTAINGTVLVNNNANITAAAGYGVDAYNWGNGDVTLNEAANTAVSGAQYGLAAYALSKGSGNVAINVGANVAVSATTFFGVQAYVSGVGNISVQTGDGDTIYGGSIGVNAQSQATSEPATSNINVVLGKDTIHSGTLNTPSGSATPGAVSVGYAPNGAQTATNAVLGNVTVQSDAQVTADKGVGINAYNWGKGNVTVSTGPDSTIHAAGNGIQTNALNGGNVSVTNGGSINAGGAGISANSSMGLGTIGGTVTVVNNGTISAGTTGIATGGNHVGAISITNNGTVTATQFAGIGGNASSGDITITNAGATTGTNGIFASTSGSANVSITNQGTATGTTFSGIGANLTAAGATGSVSITNSGTVTSLVSTSPAIGISENKTGTVTINNTGIIGSNATGQALYEGGGDITLTNTGTITGNINVGNGTFNNQAGGVWAVGTWSGFGTASTTGVVESNTINNAGTINLSTGANINGANGLVVNNSGHIDNLSGTNMINGSVTNTGTLEVASGSLEIGGGLSGAGSVLVDSGATLVLDGATAQTVTFTGNGGTLGLNSGTGGTAISGTIAAASSTGGNFTINGWGAVTAAVGDGIDFTATGGIAANMAEISVAPGGAITGAANGIVVTQNGTGDISVSTSGPIVGQAGTGILAQHSASGIGNIQVISTGNVTGTGSGSIGLEAQNLDASNGGNVSVTATGGVTGNQHAIVAINDGNGNVSVEAGGPINSTVQFGVRAATYGTGNVSVLTDAGSTINSGGAGISAVNFDTVLAASANSSVTVTNNAVINSGTTLNPSGSQPQGIAAGYYGVNGTANTNINGTVVINNNANITAAAGYGVNGYNYGNGNVTLNEAGNTSVTADQYGLGAFANSKGSGSVAINVGANVAVHANTYIGIQASTTGVGDINIQTGDGDTIYGGAIGVNAQSQATSEPATGNVMVVLGNDIIHSGTNNTASGSATPGAVSAGYAPSGTGTATNAVLGNVTVQSNAQITAAKGVGINAYNWGKGNVTVSTGTASAITAPGNGIQANALNGGNVSVTNDGSINAGGSGISANANLGIGTTGGTVTITNNGVINSATGIFAGGNHVGNISITNNSTVTGTSFAGINVNQTASGSTGSTTITNTGTVTTQGTGSAISIGENAVGTVTLGNSGTIGSSASAGAIFETGGSQMTINNSGTILGGVNTGGGGIGATTTFNNNAGGVWQTGYIDDEGTINAAGAGSTITMGTANGMNVGFSGSGSLNLSAGAALTTNYLTIGNQLGSHGTVTVTGLGTNLNATSGQTPNILIGFSGQAALSIADHATVATTYVDVGVNQVAGIVDTLDINNATLTLIQGLTIGDAGTAHATVENGGSISAGYVGLGQQAGGDGSLTIDGAGSHLAIQGDTDGVNVGYGGAGHLTLSGGATITADFVNIASLAGSSGSLTISGAGTSLDTTSGTYQNIQVGSDGTATMTISDHAIVTTTNMTLAVNHDAGVTDALTVDDASLHVGGTLTIGNSGAATALVENGGSLTAGSLILAELSGSTGSLTVDGAGSVVTASYISIGGPSAVLTLSNGGAVDVGSSAATIANTIHIGGDGSLVGTGEITSALVNDGTVTAAGGALQIDQQLTGSGSAHINAGAALDLSNGAASSQTILFTATSGSTASLVVDHAASLQAFISGFTGDGTLGGSDQIDLKDINYNSLSESYDAVNNVLNISDGTNSGAIHFIGTYNQANFSFVSDGHNGTIVYDPPVAGSTTPGSTNTGPVAEGGGFKFVASSVVSSAWIGDTHDNTGASLSQVLNMHVDALAPPSGQILDTAFADAKLLPGHDYHVL
ncbi:Ig-like domain-containing protein [Bradyrhizobium ganzhouense]|uniref:Ig-like domain-containing protein n=1 Tax=Bradyrhizobium ganzhouense TaxID=1179767 RepID=UPI003CF047BD